MSPYKDGVMQIKTRTVDPEGDSMNVMTREQIQLRIDTSEVAE